MEQKVVGVITDVSVGIRNKNAKGRVTGHQGVCIAFESSDNIAKGTFLQLEGSKNYFEVHAINLGEANKLDVEAHEVGYYGSKLDAKSDFDIRSVLEKKIELIVDEDKIKKIRNDCGLC